VAALLPSVKLYVPLHTVVVDVEFGGSPAPNFAYTTNYTPFLSDDLILDDGTVWLSRNVGNSQYTLRDIPEGRSFYVLFIRK